MHDIEDGNNYQQSKNDKKIKTPAINNFCTDLTEKAEKGELDLVVGRVNESKRTSQILSRRNKRNPILLGEPGSGKTALVEKLALDIINNKVPKNLLNKRIVSLDLAYLIAGTKYRGQFEDRLKSLIDELKDNKDIILFVDEIHNIIGAGSASGSMDAANILKPALARGEIQVIGATTLEEYRLHFEKDGALARRFQKVVLDETSVDETIEIIKKIKDKFEAHHKVQYTDEAIETCVKLADRYIVDRAMPDKAIDILDEAGSVTNMEYEIPKFIIELEHESERLSQLKLACVNQQDFDNASKYRDEQNQIKEKIKIEKNKWLNSLNKKHTLVTPEIISEVVSSMTGIPVSKLDKKESNKLSSLANNLKKRVIGQDDAVDKITKGIKRARVGMKDPNKPIIASLLIGNSGVGKTELAKQLAKELFGGEDALIRLDMSEYSSATSVSKIIGSDKGYVGYDDKTILDQVRQKPYSVVLFDEIEKAHSDVYNIFLQMFDEGHLTNSKGLKVSFKNCVILLTSNVGTKIVRDYGLGVGFQTKITENNSEETIKNNLIKELEKKFTPEFLNRLNEIIYFKDLNEEDSMKIVNLELKKSIKKASDLGYNIKIDNSLVKYICKEGFNVKFGARNLKRAIEKHFEDFFTDYVIENGKPDDSVIVFYYDEKEKITKIKNKKPI